jgi:hypothetical protein
MNAVICNKWPLDLNFEWTDEEHLPENKRSYIHYLVTRTDWIAAKCWATEWLFSDTGAENGSVVEYCAGIGVQSTIAKNLLKPTKHTVLERDQKCVDHLVKLGFDARQADANKSMFEEVDYDVKFADFPSGCSALSIRKNWKGWWSLFDSKPKLVVWTDTAVAYPATVYGHKYAELFGVPEVRSWEAYISAYSKWLWREKGFCIKKAAFRGRNALYLSAVPYECEPETKKFDLKQCLNGFVLSSEG